ncbi:ribosomal large subunit pseudouridine synthase F [Escherichia coli]|uniref:Ribosomal large subunit pseudouridine synthase F n=1 Tax=Escherichia coli TaxID=562 RepID=A0A2X3K889_ECOLX|nr:ribosomal large subunit pseudouridine synthase F [Escherichia coli]
MNLFVVWGRGADPRDGDEKVQSQKRSAVCLPHYPGAGLNRQIRRMCEHFGYEVKKLERTRIMNVSLSGIPLGEWRDLTDDELIDLFKLIENSSSEAKPKVKAKPKTAGIKRPLVKMEKTSEKGGRPASNGKRFTSPGVKRRGVNQRLRALVY